jgi:GntR family transcriptional regulator, rspAB operon transcriptional repressor
LSPTPRTDKRHSAAGIQGALQAAPQGEGPVSEHAYDQLRSAILRGDLPVGTLLSEGELAETLGISRTPVRQALRLLRQEDLVEAGPRRQLVVRGISGQRRREVFIVREALERLAVTEASRVMSLDDIDGLRLVLMRQKRAADAEEGADFIDLDEQFHLKIAEGAQLPIVVKFLGQIRAFVRLMGIEAVGHPGRMKRVLKEHEAILDAIEARNAESALEALTGHLATTERVIEAGRAADDEDEKAAS